MLILSRKIGEPVLIANDLLVVPQRIDGDRIKLGFVARDPNIRIHRLEVALALLDGRKYKLDANDYVGQLMSFQNNDAIAELFARLEKTPLDGRRLEATA